VKTFEDAVQYVICAQKKGQSRFIMIDALENKGWIRVIRGRIFEEAHRRGN